MVNLKSVAIAATCWSAGRIDVFRVGFNSDLQRKTLDSLFNPPFLFLRMTPLIAFISSIHFLNPTKH
jgi:hypothetical protein